MKRLLIAALLALPMGLMAQTTLTPQEQLEQAQRQLQEAQAALEQAKANAAKAEAEAKAKAEAEAKAKAEAEAKAAAEAQAKADAEAQAKAAAIQKQIEEAKAETERLNREAARLREENTATNATVLPTPTQPATTTVPAETTTQTAPAAKLTLPGEEATTTKNEDMSRYLAEGTVPVVDGYVTWTTEVAAPGHTAQQVYDKLLTALTQLTQGKEQLDSRLIKDDAQAHTITSSMHEWLTFSASFLSLDRTEFFYVINADCHDGGATVTMSRMKYVYTQQDGVDRFNAEEWITDKVAVNKKRTRLFRITGKFRRGTIDRKDAIFKYLNDAIKLL